MKIQLQQHEIERAVVQFLDKSGINTTSKSVGMTFTAGRGDRGLSVEVSIDEPGASTATIGTVSTGDGQQTNAQRKAPTPPAPQQGAAPASSPAEPPAAETPSSEGQQSAASAGEKKVSLFGGNAA